MPTLLHINVSPRGNQSISRRLSDAAVEAWKESNPEGRVIERDLAKTPLTFVDLDWIAGAFSPPEYHTESHKKALALSDELVSEVLEADEIILGTPMYNFSIPAALKAWIDHIVRAGKTFRYRADGTPEGLLAGKKMLVIVASGGSYDERSGMSALDHEVPYLRFIFGFMGITDVHVMQAGGTGAVMKGRVSAVEFLAPYLGEIAAPV
jgi:FMN-dependent NADH-azoreductase